MMEEKGKIIQGPFARNSQADVPEAEAPAAAPQTFEDLPLAEIQYGEELLGTLTDEETELFIRYYNAQADFETRSREMSGDMVMSMGQGIKSGKINPERGFEIAGGLDPAEVRECFRAQRLAAFLQNKLFWDIGERYGCHDHFLGIRTKRRIVRAKRKW